MGERSDQIERQIEETRCELSENISELEQKVKTAIDWRAQFQERPGTLLALAFGGGVILSALLTPARPRYPRRDSRRSYTPAQEPATSERDFTTRSDRPTYTSATTRAEKERSQARENLEAFGGALLNVAVSRASTFFDGLLPGFQQEFARARASRSHERNYSSRSAESHWPSSSIAGAD